MNVPRVDITDIDPRNGPRRSRLQRYGAVAAALSLVGALTAFAADPRDDAIPAANVAAVDASARTIGDGRDSYASVIDRVAPTVVTVRSTQRARTAEAQLPFMSDPFFRRFFDDEGDGSPALPQPRRQQGLGSGVIVRQDGYILTNHHVIDGADKITVELSDRRSFTAKVVGSDAPSDLAVLKIDGTGFPALPLGDSDQVRVGDVVLALGNPMGVGQTVTMGIISAKGRATGLGDGSFEDFLQTDAPINQGNSGGALVNTRGELVGINSQIVSMSGGNIGIGFAIPAKMAKHVMDALIEDGRVHRGMIGVSVQTVTPDLAESLRLEKIGGAIVSDVQEGSPADKAGIQRRDVVVAIDGAPVADSNMLRNRVAQMQPGSKARLTVIRDGREQTVTVTLGELPTSAAQAGREAGGGNTGGAGLTIQPVSPDVARRLELEQGTGVQVSNVDPSGPAAEAGFRRGDVIVEVDGMAVKSASDLRTALTKAGDRPALVLVRRDGAALYLPLSLS